ncbi:MAG TPA: glycoside hydrolase family 15 protein [Thermoplasmata archaeon]|nr:glycoside hydrolase family 15 protein [Thermoplasmata archaeon]
MDGAAGERTGGEAFGAPGLPPRWTRGNKDGVGTAYSADGPLWFTLWRGIVTEVYFPTIDRPQLRDLQFLISDGRTFFHDEKRQLEAVVEPLSHHALGFRVRAHDVEGRYRLEKEVLALPHLPALVERVRFVPAPAWRSRLHLYVLAAPHLDGGGAGNSARRLALAGRTVLTASRGASALALGASVPFRKTSCGFVGQSDGWTDLAENLTMDWEFASATNGNVALTGELAWEKADEFSVVLALGRGEPHATSMLLQALATPYAEARARFLEQWERACRHLRPLAGHTGDSGRLLHASYSVLLAHEDKVYPGAFIASLSIPWGASRGDDERGGYHLVWTRDLVQTATGLLAAGNTEAPLRALVYLASRQRPDGGFPQNFWISGEPYWTGLQLDEVCHPILLAWRLGRANALAEFDPYPMVLAAAGFLVLNGPSSPQDRWEEVAGYSPSTLAAQVAALTAASEFARERGESEVADFLVEYADFVEGHLDDWTLATDPTLPGAPSHYVRVRPCAPGDAAPPTGPEEVVLPNQPPGAPERYPYSEVVDGGFLELVRYGVRAPDDPAVLASLAVTDRLLRVETPFGPAWRRYNHDGYGERADGSAFEGSGRGRAWPLLTGERALYELAAGHDAVPLVRALERFASQAGLLPEQVWDEADRPELHLALGRPTGSAMPLAWAHAEYLTLLRSLADGRPFPRIPAVADRYAGARRHGRRLEVWKLAHRTPSVAPGRTLRVVAAEPFRLRWSRDGWATADETASRRLPLGVDFVDLPVPEGQREPLVFTFYWPEPARWQGEDFSVAVVPEAPPEPRAPARPSGPARSRTTS